MKIKNEKLDAFLLNCNVVLFGNKDLYSFINSLDIKEDISKFGNLNYFDFKFSKYGSITEINFYTILNKWEAVNKIRDTLKKYGSGFSYSIKKIEEQ